MKAKILLFLFCLLSINMMGQSVTTRNSVRKKKVGNTQIRKTPTKPSRPSHGYVKGHEWVDLGLSVKWATMNVGASTPSDFGGYYAWGETSTKESYEWSNCFDCLDNKGDSWDTYRFDGQTKITPSSGHDTARENWGGSWRMPTEFENSELVKMCRWTWTSMNDHEGFKVTGPNGNSIFLPAAGLRLHYGKHVFDARNNSYSWGSLVGVGKNAYFWSSTLSQYSECSCTLWYGNGYIDTHLEQRRHGLNVRPVTE